MLCGGVLRVAAHEPAQLCRQFFGFDEGLLGVLLTPYLDAVVHADETHALVDAGHGEKPFGNKQTAVAVQGDTHHGGDIFTEELLLFLHPTVQA